MSSTMMVATGTSTDDTILVDVAVLSGTAEARAAFEPKFGDVRSFVGMARLTLLKDAQGIEEALAGIYPEAHGIFVEIGHRPGIERIAVAFAL
ncbi:hypothetical protein [Methylobacterium sp. 092160098-2]|uniref:hypothetical protein n=1 Tax=Methylobacterium sp. 092160098-2 TaxID=3025129 RepID=UPI002381B0E1|nr:hypothetical protein [Methylobacterium sp. 092160098-2]MDE4914960.1 hypothetical protein [Methylobacterium sp. 092160098-2]